MTRYWPLIWAGVWRKPVRTVLTMLCIVVAFVLFGLLHGVDAAFDAAVARSRVDRLLVDARFDAPLPRSYLSQIERVPGVSQVAWTAFLPAYYQDPGNGVVVVATEPERFFAVRHEFVMSPEHRDALLETRTGIIALESLARANGWSVGDRITLGSAVARRDGEPGWTFDLVGTMTDPDNPGGFPFALARYDYFDEARAIGRGTVTRFVLRIEDPRRSVEVSRAIDALFESSPAPSLTQAENEMAQTALATIGDVGTLTAGVMGAVFFAILFLTGNVVLQSVRERTPELAVLKTLGFSDGSVLLVILLEAVLLCACGAALGLAFAAGAFPLISLYMIDVSAWLGNPELSPSVFSTGLGLALVLALVSGALPAWHARRVELVDALRDRA